MLKRLMRGLLPFAVAGLSVSPLFSQSSVDGAIGGTVQDATGAAVPGATIVVHSNTTNAEQTIVADGAGVFRAVHLEPSLYTVTITAPGFENYRSTAVTVQVGLLTDISPQLHTGSNSETIDVAGEAPAINTTTPDFSNVIDSHTLQDLPVNNYRWSSYALLTPGVVNDSNGFGLLSFRGQSTLLNNVNFDGADDNQAYFAEERGRTRAGYSTAKASVQEFQVNTSNYSVEYGRSAGGVVNSITKSGSNQFHGEGYFYDRDAEWGAANAFTDETIQTTPGGPFTSVPFKPTDVRKQWGGAVGGPILKDKLFFFFAADKFQHNFPALAVASNPSNFFATPDAMLPGGKVCGGTGAAAPSAIDTNACTLQTALGLSTYGAAATDYVNGVAALNTMLGVVPRTGSQTVFFPKVDWQVNSKNHASLEVNRLRWVSPAGIQTGSTVNDGSSSFGNDYVRDTFAIAKLDSVLSAHISNEVRYQYGRDFEFEFAQPSDAYEQNNLSTTLGGYTSPFAGLPPNVSITNAFAFGTPTFLQRAALPDERRWQTADTVNWIRGNHSIKFGGDYIHTYDLISNLSSQFGGYSYPSLTSYLEDFYLSQNPATVSQAHNYSSYSQAFGPAGLNFTTGDFSFFVQDDWKVTRNLSLTGGLRYEFEQLPSMPSTFLQGAAPGAGFMPSNKGNIGPRVGFAYDPFGTGKTIVRGGYGVFFARVINSTIFNALIDTGSPNGQDSYAFTNTQTGRPVFPEVIPTQAAAGAGGGIPAGTFFDKNFKLPEIQQMDLTVEQNLGWNSVFSLSWLGTLGRRLPDFVDTNLPAPTTITYNVIDSSGKGPLAPGSTITSEFFARNTTANCTSHRPNCAFGAITDIFSGVNSNYQALVAQFAHRLSNHIQLNANYTWSHALDYGENNTTGTSTNALLDPNNLRADYGNSNQNVPNRFVINAVATAPWQFGGWKSYLLNEYELSPSYQQQNGLPYSFGTSGTLSTAFAPTGNLGAIGGGENGSGGAARVIGFDRNALSQAGTKVFDLRVSKRFTVAERLKLELLAESFNLFNNQNVTGVNSTAYTVGNSTNAATKAVTGNTLTFNTSAANATQPLFGSVTSTNSSGFAYSPRELQLGIRAQF